jgi:hypothetical protein
MTTSRAVGFLLLLILLSPNAVALSGEVGPCPPLKGNGCETENCIGKVMTVDTQDGPNGTITVQVCFQVSLMGGVDFVCNIANIPSWSDVGLGKMHDGCALVGAPIEGETWGTVDSCKDLDIYCRRYTEL